MDVAQNMPEPGALALLLPFLGAAVVMDLANRRIPNALVAAMLVVGLYSQTFVAPESLLWSAGGALVGFLILIPFYALGGMGAGDVKLLAAAGSFLGPMGALLAGVATLAAGGVLGLCIAAWRLLQTVPIVARLPLPRPPVTEPVHLPYSLAIASGVLIMVAVW
jgi:prepilin peptidase CpaA